MDELLLNMDQMPDTPVPVIDETIPYELKITRAEKIIASTGAQMLQMDLEIVGTDKNIYKENLVITKKDGKMNWVGNYVLKKILKATNVKIEGSFGIQMAATLLKGKSFIGEIKKVTLDSGKIVYELGDAETFTQVDKEEDTSEVAPNPEPTTEQDQIDVPQEEIVADKINPEDW